ncbi:MAG: tRNA uridine-5-carboxymethylaminomethyl(34) synthesis GTPase MnmE [Deltaproteobacteria bacterium]|jgi:tRNA modification GTPase|nr:tRNA uridine-5-carboxymethylaminomethyl(34) synthesis GTPase MnmE [Deltaproteobacteria bacterium]MBT4526838.1 tRNA uridine-5-carboxymethylaminomethyl(34) synthesis GTPase MnmE [Deltaproteobacteria bacterium]
MSLQFDDTIVGIATAPGECGVSIIRISGEQALKYADHFFKPKFSTNIFNLKNRHLAYGWIIDNGKTIDEVLAAVMRRPHSFTAEDVVEIQCHGGSYITQTILNLAINAGARLANPGEFTQRAFLNGRIDLTQAEATNDLIQAKSELGLNLIVNQLKGNLHQKILDLKNEVIWISSLVNAGIDFPEEDIVFSNYDQISDKIAYVKKELESLIESSNLGIMVREGYKVVLVGEPNVGKSSILNALLNVNRSIVTQIPGTTRDTIEEYCNINGIPVSLTDTAGIHRTSDAVEQEGINRSFEAITKADLILWVIDMVNPSYQLDLPDHSILKDKPVLVVFNKIDLQSQFKKDPPQDLPSFKQITISAKDKSQIQELRKTIFEFISGKTGKLTEETAITNLRQKIAAEKSLEQIERLHHSIKDTLEEELLAIDLTEILSLLGDIVGETTPDDMLNQIFENFCIGK